MTDAGIGAAAGSELTPKPSQLSRELTEFLIELSVGMHKHAIYPRGHPLLALAVDSVHRSLMTLLADRPALSIGVARRQLVIEGVATGSSHPLLAELAGKLHRHHIGAVKFIRGVEREEIADSLAAVGVEVQINEQPLGMTPERIEGRWANVRLFPLTYDRLELLDEEDDENNSVTRQQGTSGKDGRAAQLWVGLARAAIAADNASKAEDAPLEPERVAQAIDQHDREPAYDQVIVGYLLQIAKEVRADDTPVAATAGLKRRISKLVGALQPTTLRRLLDMGGDVLQRRQFVMDAAQGMSVDAVVELVQAAASAEHQTISHSLVRMLTKLANHATHDSTSRGQAADGEFRAHVERLVSSWSLDDPNPLAYSAALEELSHKNADGAPTLAADGGDSKYPCEPERVLAMALEIGAVGDTVTRAIVAMLEAQSFADLLDMIDAAPPASEEVITHSIDMIVMSNPLRTILSAQRLDHQLIRRMIARVGLTSAPALIAALNESSEGTQRERLAGYLFGLGVEVAPVITAALPHASPGVVRELLLLLGRLAPKALPIEARVFLTHPDFAVRREATRLLLAYKETRDSALSVAVRDEDQRVVYAALQGVQGKCPGLVANTLRQRIDRGELADPTTCAAAIRVVSTVADDDTLKWVMKRTIVPGGFLRRQKLAPISPEMLAALTALATRWGSDKRASDVLQKARASTSSTVRAAAQPGGGRATIEREAMQ